MLGEFYGYTFHYCLFKLTVGQALTLIDVKNDRERQMAEETERRKAHGGEKEYQEFHQHPYDINDEQALPTANDVIAIFGGMGK